MSGGEKKGQPIAGLASNHAGLLALAATLTTGELVSGRIAALDLGLLFIVALLLAGRAFAGLLTERTLLILLTALTLLVALAILTLLILTLLALALTLLALTLLILLAALLAGLTTLATLTTLAALLTLLVLLALLATLLTHLSALITLATLALLALLTGFVWDVLLTLRTLPTAVALLLRRIRILILGVRLIAATLFLPRIIVYAHECLQRRKLQQLFDLLLTPTFRE
jgi:hypothetical protein